MTNANATTRDEREDIEARLRSFIATLEMDVEIDTECKDGSLYFNVHGKDQRYFLANKTEALRSLGFLLQTYLEHRYPDSKTQIKMDADHFHKEKENEINELAHAASAKLTKVGDQVTLDPLNPYDRRLVHIALKEIGNMESKSLGDGHYKRMVISYVGGDEDAS